jgi:undecaprenyl-diphosphatase
MAVSHSDETATRVARLAGPSRARLCQGLWAVGLLGGGAFAILAVKVSRSDPNRVDRAVERLLAAPRASTVFDVFTTLSLGGTPFFVGGAALVLAGLAWWRTRDLRWAAFCILAPTAAGLLELATKQIVGRRRPVSAELWGERRFGFPSGHATGAAALATVVVLLALVWGLPRRRRQCVIALAVAFAITVSVSRIVVDDHLTMDSIGGLLLGASASALVGAIALRSRRSP